MSTKATCPVCSTPLPSDAPRGLCPSCLLTPRPPIGITRPKLETENFSLRYFGDYELIEEIARGGMGVVYKARQASLNRIVAVKMILSGQLANPADVARFRAEAEAAANLQHPNIVAIHEVGEHEGHPYFSMDYVDGRNLAELVRDGPLAAKRAAEIMRTVAEAIHYAHGKGVLHRDLKPSNVLIDDFDEPSVTDFGLAKRISLNPKLATGNSELDLTLTGQALGTPQYMPPEQARGHAAELGPHSDVYSLGGILFFLLTGRAPFVGETIEETLHQVFMREPVSPRLLRPGVPRDLETICLKCLEKDPRRRYRTAQELAAELGCFLRDEPVRARPVAPAEKFWRWCRRRPAVAGLSASVVVLLTSGAIVSSLAAVRLKAANERANSNLQQAQTNLWDSYLAQAHAGRWSGRMGRRFDSLAALRKAAAIRPSLELRNEAIASLVLSDARQINEWSAFPPDAFFAGFDAENRRYAFGDSNGVVHVCRVGDASEMIRLPGFEPPFQDLHFSPDGRCLFVACGGILRRAEFWDLERKEILLSIIEPNLRNMNFSADSRYAAVSSNLKTNYPVRIFDLQKQEEVASFSHGSLVSYIYFHPRDSSRLLISDRSSQVRVWDWTTGKVIQSLEHPNWVEGIASHPEGKTVATACADGKVRLWDATTGRERTVMASHEGAAVSVTFSHDGAFLASRGWEGSLRLWNPSAGKEALNLLILGYSFPFSRSDNRLGYYAAPGRMAMLEVVPGEGWRALRSEPERADRTISCDFSSDGRLLLSAQEHGVRLWDAGTGRELATVLSGGFFWHYALFLPGENRFVTASKSGIQGWTVTRDAENKVTIRAEPEQFFDTRGRSLYLTRTGNLLSFAQSGNVHFLNPATLRETGQIGIGLARAVVSFSPDGKWMAACVSEGTFVQIWDVAASNLVRTLPTKAGSVRATFSPNGRWLAVGDGLEFVLWDVASWQPLYTIEDGRTGFFGFSAFSPDSSMLAISHTRNTVRLIDTASGQELATLNSPEPMDIANLVFSPDGRYLAVPCGPGPIQIWDLGLIRPQLAAMKLDWDLPPLPPQQTHAPVAH